MATVNTTKVCDCGKPKLEKFPTCKDCKVMATAGAGKTDDKPKDENKPEEKKKEVLLSKVEVRKVGGDGEYSLHIQATGTNKKGFKCKILISDEQKYSTGIIPGKNNAFVDSYQFPTNALGFLVVKLAPFTDSKRYLIVEVIGTQYDKTIRLDGEKEKAKTFSEWRSALPQIFQ